MTTPEFLTLRHGSLRQGLNDSTWLVLLEGHPQYKLVATPSKGKFSCSVMQTVNGKRLDKGEAIFGTIDEAIVGGLEELRVKLGW